MSTNTRKLKTAITKPEGLKNFVIGKFKLFVGK